MDTMNATRTEQVIYEMLTENTGANLLDSGGAYGRNHERNRSKSLDDFRDEARTTFDTKWGDVSVSLFHHLVDKLHYESEEDNYFHAWAKDKDDYWLQLVEDYADFRGWTVAFSENSYNRDSNLSQVIQYTVYSSGLVALQVHGGCDVRGGYTAPRIFSIDEEYSLVMEDASIYCTGDAVDSDGPHRLDGNAHEWYYEGEYSREYSPYAMSERRDLLKLDYLPCPICGAPMKDGAQV
jgi:hypothetical protein